MPPPSSLDTIAALPEFEGAIAMVVPLKASMDKVVRINITVPEQALSLIDRAAERLQMNRSGYLTWSAQRLAQAAEISSQEELTDWARAHLLKGRPVGSMRFAVVPLGAMSAEEAARKLTNVKPRRRPA